MKYDNRNRAKTAETLNHLEGHEKKTRATHKARCINRHSMTSTLMTSKLHELKSHEKNLPDRNMIQTISQKH